MTNELIIGNAANGIVEAEGVLRDFSSYEQARQYLTSYSYGTLHHDQMEDQSFLFLKYDGTLWFFDFNKQQIEPVSKAEEIQFSNVHDWSQDLFYYRPGHEMSLLNGGEAWFASIREVEPVEAMSLPSP